MLFPCLLPFPHALYRSVCYGEWWGGWARHGVWERGLAGYERLAVGKGRGG